AGMELPDVDFRGDACLEQRADRDTAWVFAQLFLQHVARGAAGQRLADGRVVARMLAWRDVDEGAAGDSHRRARHPQHKPVAGGSRYGSRQVQLDPALTAGRYVVAVEDDHAATGLDG